SSVPTLQLEYEIVTCSVFSSSEFPFLPSSFFSVFSEPEHAARTNTKHKTANNENNFFIKITPALFFYAKMIIPFSGPPQRSHSINQRKQILSLHPQDYVKRFKTNVKNIQFILFRIVYIDILYHRE